MKNLIFVLVAFLGNYIINNVVAAIVALIPASQSESVLTPQYIAYVILAAIFAAGFAWLALWMTSALLHTPASIKNAVMFGVVAFIVSIVTAFVTGVTGVLAQTGSLSQMFSIIPNFGPFLLSWSTLVLLAYWVIPSAVMGWMQEKKAAAPAPMV
jgi:hypothetical protein